MVADEVKELRDGITNILVAIARLDEQVKALADIAKQVQATEVKVASIERDLKTCFVRYDEMHKSVDDIQQTIIADKRDNKEDRKWLLGVALGVGSLVLYIIEMIQGGA